jgi:long-subunit acyl-CoA synthetase (AMP-forming)
MLVGTAATNADTLYFFKACLDCIVIEGYGSSEASGIVTL